MDPVCVCAWVWVWVGVCVWVESEFLCTMLSLMTQFVRISYTHTQNTFKYQSKKDRGPIWTLRTGGRYILICVYMYMNIVYMY